MGHRFGWTEHTITGWNGAGEWATPVTKPKEKSGRLLQFVVVEALK